MSINDCWEKTEMSGNNKKDDNDLTLVTSETVMKDPWSYT